MRTALFLAGLVLVASACRFDPGGVAAARDAGGPVAGDGGGADAMRRPPPPAPDSGPVTCSPGARVCDGRVLRTCASDGKSFKNVTCDFTCTGGSCAFVSNLKSTDYAQCDGSAPALTPRAGTTVRIAGGSAPTITCAPDCGDGRTTTIASRSLSQTGGPSLALFCLSKLSIPSGVTVASTGRVTAALAFVVDGSATITGTLDVSGGAATATAAGGPGPGGGSGAGPSAAAGATGQGAGAGQGGQQAGNGSNVAAGGGGGGGFGGGGGGGGRGQNQKGDQTAAGGSGGGPVGNPPLSPLLGGSGGGSGAAGDCGGQMTCGWPGGGGGGAVQIASRISIDVGGKIDASGGDGFGEVGVGGGGGGGGSGGAVLLEAPVVTVGGLLSVDGGRGGSTSSGGGGSGATGGRSDGSAGADFASAGEGGSGGGGGGGRIRIKASGTAGVCDHASPAPLCTSHPL